MYMNKSTKTWTTEIVQEESIVVTRFREDTHSLTQVAFWQVGQVLCMHIFCSYCFDLMDLMGRLGRLRGRRRNWWVSELW